MTEQTGVYRVTPGVYSGIIFRRMLSRYLWLIILPVLAFLFMGSEISSTWYYLIPITVFLVVPLLFAGAYYNASLNREAVEALKPHRIRISDGGVEFEEIDFGDGKPEENKIGGFVFYSSGGNVEWKVTKSYSIGPEDVAYERIQGGMRIIGLKGNAGRFLVLPVTGIPDKQKNDDSEEC